MMSYLVRMCFVYNLQYNNSWIYTQEDEDRFREGEGEEGGDEENMIDILGVQPIPAFCSRCVVQWNTMHETSKY